MSESYVIQKIFIGKRIKMKTKIEYQMLLFRCHITEVQLCKSHLNGTKINDQRKEAGNFYLKEGNYYTLALIYLQCTYDKHSHSNT